MILTILISFIALMGLLIIHEFGHFILAKKFGVKVEEFGVGYPPRLIGKKIGETIYSVNLLPFGAFVKMPGETEKSEDPGSFSRQPVGNRILIVLAGVISFWIVSAILFSIVFGIGTYVAISDAIDSNLVNLRVQITAIAKDSPAEKAGLKPGDTIINFTKVKDVQEFAEQYKGKEIVLTIERGKDVFDAKLTPRENPPSGQGAMGVALARMTFQSYPWYKAPFKGIQATFNMTGAVIQGYGEAISKLFLRQPTGVTLTGPIGVFHLFAQASQMGASYFFQFTGMVAIYIALFNLLPIPAVDGGKILFLLIEAVKRKPMNYKVEQNITAVFFGLLLLLMVFITVKDVIRIF
ncbi:MAG: site-2 protease family protein [Candidatus Nealsonbacteria bacterium]|nr:site-2 protease family protein [Candidatus Nealsonbacteria bacterium]